MSSDVPGVAMRSTQSGMVIGQALSSFDGGNGSDIGMVIMFVKNHYRQSNSESASTTTIDIVRNETPVNALTAISDLLSSGVKMVTEFVSARVTAVRGYFDEVFANKVHTEELCIKKSDGSEVCINGDQVDILLQKNGVTPTTNTPTQTFSESEQLPTPTTPNETSTTTSEIITSPTNEPTLAETQADIPPIEPEMITPAVDEPTPVIVEPAPTPEPEPDLPADEAGADSPLTETP